MSKGRFASSGVVVGQTRRDRRDQRSDQLKGNKVTMGKNVPRQTEGAVGDITVREISTVGLRCYIKTDSGWFDINAMVASFQPKWVDLSLINGGTKGWFRKSTDHDIPGYMKDMHGFVHLRGVVKMEAGTEDGVTYSTASKIATLPSSFRPSHHQYREVLDYATSTPASANTAVFKIETDGDLYMSEGASAAGNTLDGISFYAGKKATSVTAGQEFEQSDIGHGVVL